MFVENFNVNREMIVWQNRFDAVTPFDQGKSGSFEILLRSELEKLIDVAQPINIEMINRDGSLIFVNQNVSWTGNSCWINSSGFGDCPDKSGFSGSESPDQGNDAFWRKNLKNFLPDKIRLRFILSCKFHKIVAHSHLFSFAYPI